MHSVVRIYNNGSRIQIDFRTEDDMDAHLEHSVHARFGCAHFRDGVCVSRGYLSKERCEEIEAEFRLAKARVVNEP